MSTPAGRPAAPSAMTLHRARAFNLGSDARLAGLPLSACAAAYPTNEELAACWRHGWQDVQYFWADEAPWACRDLPEVL